MRMILPRVAMLVALVIMVPPSLARDADAQRSVGNRIREICAYAGDDPAAPERLFEEVRALGETGRRELLSLVRRRRPDAPCALHYLNRLGDRRAIPLIRDILLRERNAPYWLLMRAVNGAAVFEDAACFAPVLEIFRLKDGDLSLAGQAAFALVAMEREEGRRAVREALTAPEYTGVRLQLIAAVGVRGHVEAIEPLLTAADKYPMLMGEVARSLVRIATPQSRAAGVEMIDRVNYPEPWLRKNAISDVYYLLRAQKDWSKNPTEIAEIEALMKKLDDMRMPK